VEVGVEKAELAEALKVEKIKVKRFEVEVTNLNEILRELRWEYRNLERTQAFEIEKAKDSIRKEMEKSLIESDLKRVEAVAKYNTYIEMDTKEERTHIQKMLEKAIDALGKAQATVNVKG
jgi:hypothetical protein